MRERLCDVSVERAAGNMRSAGTLTSPGVTYIWLSSLLLSLTKSNWSHRGNGGPSLAHHF